MADRYREDGNNTEIVSGKLHVDLEEGDSRTRPVLPAADFVGPKKKATSFQITSVTVQGNRLSNDGGDDSADDLDESHTEDISSDILDLSKTTELDNDPISSDNSNSNIEDFPPASRNSIPVSTVNIGVPVRIGVPSEITDANVRCSDASSGVTLITTTANAPTVNAQEPVTVNSLPDHWQHRFKVVKLANSQPFKKGRWLCMDFTDPPVTHNEHKHDVSDVHIPMGHEAVSAPSSISALPIESVPIVLPAERPNTMTNVYEITMNQSGPAGISVPLSAHQTAQPIYGILMPVSTNAVPSVTMVQTIAMPTPSDRLVYSGQVLQTQAVLAPVQPTQVTLPMSLHNAVPHHQPMVPHTTQTMPHIPLTVPMPQQQTPVMVSQPIASKPVVSAPDPSLVMKVEQSYVPSHASVPQIAADNAGVGLRISSIVNQQPILDGIPDTLATKPNQDIEESESAPAGTNTVAIDNKIEQAMDLVKSHLMFAVREEVDVLKERITELVDHITRLEQENTILRANASTETLSMLGQTTAQPPVQQINQQQQPQMVPGQHPVTTQTSATT